MPERTIDKSIPIPLYYQLKTILLESIKEGIYKPGDYIPTEQELIEKYNLSRTTVRQAIVEMANEGYIVRYKGKGTIVAKSHSNNNICLDIQSGILETGAIVRTDLIDVERTKATPLDQEYLRIDENEEVVVLKRLRFGNDEPVSYSSSTVPLSLFPNIEKDAKIAKDHLYDYLGNCGYTITSRETYVYPEIADQKTAELLRIKRGAALLLMIQIGFVGDKPVEWSLTSLKKSENVSLHFRSKETRT